MKGFDSCRPTSCVFGTFADEREKDSDSRSSSLEFGEKRHGTTRSHASSAGSNRIRVSERSAKNQNIATARSFPPNACDVLSTLAGNGDQRGGGRWRAPA